MDYQRRLVLIFQIIIIFFIFVNLFLIFEIVKINTSLDVCKKERTKLIDTNTALSKRITYEEAANADIKKNIPTLTDADKLLLEKKGLQNPCDDIINDLQSHAELMPFEGIFGTRFSFYKEARVYVLNSEWVYTFFDDGNKVGQTLLEYEITNVGKIKWEKIGSVISENN